LGTPQDVHASIDLLPEPRAAREARGFIAEHLRDNVAEDVASTAVLLTSELVTNVVVHARSPMRLEVDLDAGRVRVAVVDAATAHPVPRVSHGGRLTGRGINLVATLSRKWGVEPEPQGKRVWFELPA
jgi:anti-sigma regulatory factor (Ser/Thr protein kinase)